MSLRLTSSPGPSESLSPDTSQSSTLGAIWTSRHQRPGRIQLGCVPYASRADRRAELCGWIFLAIVALGCFYVAFNPDQAVDAAETATNLVARIGGR